MINYLKGQIVFRHENSPSGCNVTIEVNNIGYLVLTNRRILNQLPLEGEIATIFTSLIHKEDAMYLCGFSSREDRDLFNLLQSVSGIGIKSALLMLEEMDYNELISAVITGDHKAISRAKGVGPKLAQRVILELKDKMTNWRDKVEMSQIESIKIEGVSSKESYTEAESVLLSLGYSKKEAIDSLKVALGKCENAGNSEELLRHALHWLALQ